VALLILLWPHDINDFDALNRNLDGKIRQVLNGRLGFFFNLKYVGISAIACLVLLPQIYSNKNKSLDNATKVLLLLLLFTGIFLSFFAYINYRYISTLTPLMIGLLIIFSAILFNNNEQKNWLWSLLILQTLAFAITIAFSFYPKYKNRLKGNVAASTSLNKLNCPNIYTYINDSLAINNKVLVNNLPEFFLRTQHQGVFYWSGDDEYFNKKGIFNLLKDKSDEQVVQFLNDSLFVTYILTNKQLAPYNHQFNLILQSHCKLCKTDQLGNELYQLL
jgi:uncharacterized membrane protein (DUF373 family)